MLFCLLQLEDKRVQMERQLISMKVQYLSLQKQNTFSKQQLQRMKVPHVVEGSRTNTGAMDMSCRMTEWMCMCCAGPGSHSDTASRFQG